MELLKSHRTIRNYALQSIPDEILNDILECGIRSSNTGNMQLYSVVVTKENALKERLAPFHFNQPMIREANVVLTICVDFNRFLLWCKANGTTTDFYSILWLLNGFIDASILAQNISVAAESYDIGICYLGTTLYNSEEISKILKLPNGVFPVTTLTLGYPKFVPEKTDRLPLEAVIHGEVYHDYTEEQIKEMYAFKENLASSKEYVVQNSKRNLAEVYTEVRYKTTDSLFFSKKVLKFLQDQGFKFES